LQDLIEDSSSSGNSYFVEEFLSQDIQNLLSKLPHQQQKVLTLRFGLADGDELSRTEIGQRMGISRERVRQIEQQALSLLQQQLI
jgi:RNA polymerase nonessential primary-like sigma factor